MNPTAAIDAFRQRALPLLRADARIEAVLEAGAGASGIADRYSDLDLVLVAREADYERLLEDKAALAERLDHLLAAFTGEHVGEPRLLICLYAVPDGDKLLHVDIKVLRKSDLAHRVDDPRVLFDRDGGAAAAMTASAAVWPERPPQWFEDRIWIWLHYGAARAGRGEFHEALDMLGFVRSWILGPMLATANGRPQRGLRHIEKLPGASNALSTTLAGLDLASLRHAFIETAKLYVDLRHTNPPPTVRRDAESAVLAYIKALGAEG